jgi:purine nucleoside permease
VDCPTAGNVKTLPLDGGVRVRSPFNLQDYGDEVYRLNEDLLQAAYRLTKDVDLIDSDAAKAYRAKYSEPAAIPPPKVSICDTISSDTWWHGARLGAAMEAYARLVTNGGEANPCTTQQEDNAILTALKRGAEAGFLDFNRIAVLRTASNFDREAPGQSAAESLRARSGDYFPSVANAHRLTAKLANAIVEDWGTWSAGPPK